MRTLLGLILASLTILGCGGGGSSGPSEAPVISNLQIIALTPLVVGQTATVSFTADYVDPQGDLFGGLCRFKDTPTGNIDFPINQAGSGTVTNATSGLVNCVITGSYGGTTVEVHFAVVDRAGHESNVIVVTTVLETTVS